MATLNFPPGSGNVGPTGPTGPAGSNGAAGATGATGSGTGGNFTQTFTNSGTVTLGNTRVLVNSGTAVTITLPDGTIQADVKICNIGAGNGTVAAKVGSASPGNVTLLGSPAMSAVDLIWDTNLGFYVVG